MDKQKLTSSFGSGIYFRIRWCGWKKK